MSGEKNLGGRPSTYTDELGDLICSLMSDGESLRKICQLPDMPTTSTVFLWLSKGDRGVEEYIKFSDQYREAIDRRTEYWAEETIDISDDSDADYIFTDDGKRVTNSEAIARSRLRVDTRKWLMGKLKSKKYGEKQAIESINTNSNINANVEVQLPLTQADRDILASLGWKG